MRWPLRLLILLGAIVTGAALGAGAGLVVLAQDRCAGPICAGLVLVPMMTAAVGAVAGLIVGAVLWLRAALRDRLRAPSDAALGEKLD
jgi:hypothetical protein